MTAYVALLRGINVGGNNKIDMAQLRASCESLGYTDVSTYINSGNVLFKTRIQDEARIARTIKSVIKKDFGLTIPTVVRTRETIQKLTAGIPSTWTNDADTKSDVFFLFDGYDSPKSKALLPTLKSVDTVKYTQRALIWHIKKKDYTKSALHDVIGTELYRNSTVRNVNTVRTLANMLEAM